MSFLSNYLKDNAMADQKIVDDRFVAEVIIKGEVYISFNFRTMDLERAKVVAKDIVGDYYKGDYDYLNVFPEAK